MSGKLASRYFQIKILIAIPLLLGPIHLLLAPEMTSLADVVPHGQVIIKTQKDKHGNLWGTPATELHETDFAHISLNSSSYNDLIKCPGIGKKTASLIIRERKAKKFKDWIDLSYRIKKLSKTKIQKLKDLGVKINAL
jgi:DNA uptake protein ComE-like DNA-binding protein